MTFSEFQKRFRQKTTGDRYYNYFICAFPFCIAFVGLFFAIKHPEKFLRDKLVYFVTISSPLALGIYFSYKLPNRYKMITIENELSLLEKKNILEPYFRSMGAWKSSNEGNYTQYQYRKNFWNSSLKIHLFYDEEQISFSVQGHDNDGGFIDFGGTQKLRNKIKREIEESLSLSYKDVSHRNITATSPS